MEFTFPEEQTQAWKPVVDAVQGTPFFLHPGTPDERCPLCGITTRFASR